MTGAKKYSAGTIFLQVSPVFRRFQEDVEDYTRGIDRALGDDMERAGQRAGERAGKAAGKSAREQIAKSGIDEELERQVRDGVTGIERALGKINTRNLSKKLRGEVADMRRELQSLNDIDLNIDDNVEKVRAKVKGLEGQLDRLGTRSKIVFEDRGIPEVRRKIAQLQGDIDSIDGTIDVHANTRGAERDLTAFEKSVRKAMNGAARSIKGTLHPEVRRLRDELQYLSKLRVGPDMEINSKEMRHDLKEIAAELEKLSRENPDVDVRLEANEAWAELAALERALSKLDRDVDIDVDVHTARAQRSLQGLRNSGDDASNTFRSFNGVMLAAAGAGPALIPMLGAIAAGLLAIGPAAAVAAFGLGAVLVGFSGIGDAVGALQDRDEAAGQTAIDSARKQGDAARAVADARRAAADAIEAALERQKDAQEAYADSIDDVKEAERTLREAREAARATGDDIADRIKDNQLNRDQGLLDVFHATVAYDSTMADGSATNAEKEQARIDLEQARRRLEELREEQKELAKEKRKWDREGVNGTDEVKDAQEGLNSAIEAQRDAYEDLRDAAEDVDQARADGARRVADALRDQSEALNDVSAAQQKVDTAFDKLGPAGQQFALFIHGLRDEFKAFRDDVQAVLLPAVAQAIEGFMGSRAGGLARSALISLAADFGRFAKQLSRSFQGGAWTEFFEMLGTLGPKIQRAWGTAFIKVLEAMASMLTTLAPYALQFAHGLAAMMDRFADWAASKKGQDSLANFMDHMREVAPDVLAFFGAFVAAAVNLARALAPYAEVVLKTLTAALDFIATMDPAILGPVASAILALITASQLAYSFMMLLLAGGALVSATAAMIVFALAAIAIGVAYLWHTNEDFRDFMTKAWKDISGALSEAWNRDMKPALRDLGDAMNELWKEVIQPFLAWLGPILVRFIKWYYPMMLTAWAKVARGTAWFIRNVLIPAFLWIAPKVKWVFQKVVMPILRAFAALFGAVARVMSKIWKKVMRPIFEWIGALLKWQWKNIWKPIIRDLGVLWGGMVQGLKKAWDRWGKSMFNDISDKVLPKLKTAFHNTVEAIKATWNGLKKVIGEPLKFVLDTLINKGLIAGFNKVAGWVGREGFDPIPIPKSLQQYATGGVFRNPAYADGGVMPGYTPGRDVHRFVSPTGGVLNLSGGEPVMRPEFGAVVGHGWVDKVNAAARHGGVAGVKRALGFEQSHAKGGKIVFPVPGGYVNRTDYNLGHDGMDINHPNDASGNVPFVSATSGVVSSIGYDRGYGNAVFVRSPYGELVYGHSYDGSIQVSPGMPVAPGQWLANIGNTGNSFGAHLHFGFPGGSFAAAEALLAGSAQLAPDSVGGGKTRSIPGFIKSLLKNPLDVIKGWASSKFGDASQAVQNSPIFPMIKHAPGLLFGGFKDKVMDIIPGWAKAIGGVVGKAKDMASSAGDAIQDGVSGVGDMIGLKDGGILPYNGTMKYDSGGYLPPGLTSVLNLTGKPEPVFTDGQFREGIGGQGGTIHYEPHFEGSDLRPEDVAADLNFQFRRLRRSGKYEGVGS